MEPELADAAARAAALDAEQSFCVTAPAGSGKTELLTQRVLTLLARVDNPEEVLAITFTRKAVAEMRARIVVALRSAEREDDENAAPHRQTTLALARAVLQRDADKGWQLLANPGRLRIFTFDAFSAYLVRQMPITSGFGGAPSQEDNAEPLYLDAVECLLARLEDDSALAADIATVVAHLDCKLAELENILVDLLCKRDQWRGLYAHLQEGSAAELLQGYIDSMVEELLTGLHARLHLFGGPLCEQIDYAAGKLIEHDKPSPVKELVGLTQLPGVDPAAVKVWQTIRTLLLTDKNEWRKSVNIRQGFPAGNAAEKRQKSAFKALLDELQMQQGLLALLGEIRELPEHSYAEENWPLLQALLNVMRHLLAYLELSFQSAQKVDFSAISLRALDALGALDAPSDLALRLDYQIQHILVDEFQDTSRVQHELLARLTAEWGSDPQGRKTLFIVGDAMQSIYAFRNARVGLFMYARKHGIAELPLRPLELSTNFRSKQAIVEWVNATFETAFPPADDLRLGATPYVASTALSASSSAAEVQAFGYFDTFSKQAEAQKICALIGAAREQDPEGSIVILLRTRKQAEPILPALRAAGIDWQAAELDKLSDQACVTDLMSITRALLNPADRVAWLALLRLPMCGLAMEDLLAVAGVTQATAQQALLERIVNYQSIDTLSDDGKPRLALLSEVFGAAWEARQRKPLHYVVQGIWQALSGDAVYATPAEQDYCQRFFMALEQLVQNEEALHWQLIEDNIERQYAESTSESSAAVQIMTIHKAKGLEFDTVLLPSLHQRSQTDGRELLNWFDPVDDDGQSPLLIGLNERGNDQQKTLYSYVRFLKRRQRELESVRLLYVACTRAAKRLYLFSGVKEQAKSGDLVPAGSTGLASVIWPTIRDNIQVLDDAGAKPEARPEIVITELTRVSHVKPAAATPESGLLSTFRGREFDSDPHAAPQRNRLEKIVGTVVHTNLEQLVRGQHHNWHLKALDFMRARWQTQLRQRGVSSTDLQQALDAVQRAIRNALTDANAAWIFDAGQHDSAVELPLAVQTATGIKHYIIDRTFVLEDGTRWIIDYKTVLHETVDDLAAFDRQKSALYQQQLAAYRNAFMQAGEKKVRTGLYFPIQQHFIEVS